MANDPNKQPVQTQHCTPTRTATFTPWTIAANGLIDGSPFTCTPVQPFYALASPATLPSSGTTPDGHCAWNLVINPPIPPHTVGSMLCAWFPFGPAGPGWYLELAQGWNGPPGHSSSELQLYVGPTGTDPAGTYTAIDDTGGPSACTDPQTIVIA